MTCCQRTFCYLLNAFRKSGEKGYWQKILEFNIEDAKKKGKSIDPKDIARIYAKLGEKDKAFRWLEKAYEERKTDLVWLKISPEWDNLRSDPRFADLVWRVGLPE